MKPVKVQGSDFSWRCPQCKTLLPSATEPIATQILNTRHLPLCKGPKPESATARKIKEQLA